jgi:hypothetical protein
MGSADPSFRKIGHFLSRWGGPSPSILIWLCIRADGSTPSHPSKRGYARQIDKPDHGERKRQMCVACASLRKPKSGQNAEEFQSGFAALLSKAPQNLVHSSAFFSIPANQPPWFDTGLDLEAGEQVTVFLHGQAVLSRELDLWFHPDMQLWYRVGDEGHIFRGTRNSHTFTVERSGRLFLGNYLPGEWSTRTGAISVGTEAYRAMEGKIVAQVFRWAADPLEGLKQIRAIGDIESRLAAEIDRLENGARPPRGWDYLWFLGASEIYSTGPNAPSQRPSIACHTHRDAAILHKDVSMPLTRDLRLRWSWKVDELPCDMAENTLENHDYVSIAVEFDNGQDLTFFWSSQLPVDAGFRCPIPTWTARETHVVARSGTGDLGRWLDEERSLYSYYERFVGSIGRLDDERDPKVVAPPTRIVRVWLIANTMFRQREGRCEFGAIELVSDDAAITLN